jgi:hypothetical protein
MTRTFGWALSVAAGAVVGTASSVAVGALSPPTTVGTAQAIDVCKQFTDEAAEYGEITSVALGETSTISAAIEWQEHRHAPDIGDIRSPLRDRDEGEATICMYRGLFVTPTAPLGDGERAPQHTVLRLVIVGDEAILDSAGYEDRMAPDTPSAARSQ